MVPIVLLYRWERFLISTARKSVCNRCFYSRIFYYHILFLSHSLLLPPSHSHFREPIYKSNLLVPVEDDEYNSKRCIVCAGESQCPFLNIGETCHYTSVPAQRSARNE